MTRKRIESRIKKLCKENNIVDIEEFARYYFNVLSNKESDEERVKRYKEKVRLNGEID